MVLILPYQTADRRRGEGEQEMQGGGDRHAPRLRAAQRDLQVLQGVLVLPLHR